VTLLIAVPVGAGWQPTSRIETSVITASILNVVAPGSVAAGHQSERLCPRVKYGCLSRRPQSVAS